MRAARTRSGRCRLGSDRTADPTDSGPSSVGLSPAPSRGSPVLLGDPDPTRHGLLVGQRRSDPRTASIRHHAAITTRRNRGGGVFDQLRVDAIHAYDRIIGLDLTEVALDGSLHKAPCGGEGTGINPTDRAKLGWKWSIASTPTASRSDGRLTAPTATSSTFSAQPLTMSHEPDCSPTSTPCISTAATTTPKRVRHLASYGLADLNIQHRKPKGPTERRPLELGLRWVVEGTNSWLSNYGQLRRNTDRRTRHRHAQLCFVTALSSPPSSSTGATDGAPTHALTARPLSGSRGT